MLEDYAKDRKRSDAVLSDVAWVLKRACCWDVSPAGDYLDVGYATDLVTQDGTRVAVRSRSFDTYFGQYGNEFTLRSRRANGTETELAKVRKNVVRYGFYGFCQGFEHRFFRIIDFNIFNIAVDVFGLDDLSVEKQNKSEETFFRAFDVTKFARHGLLINYKYGWC